MFFKCLSSGGIYFIGWSAGEELRGGEQAGTGAEDPAGKEAWIAAEASGCLVPEPPSSVED